MSDESTDGGTEDGVRAVVAAEIAERRAAALDYDGHGRDEQSERLRAEADALAALLGPPPAG